MPKIQTNAERAADTAAQTTETVVEETTANATETTVDETVDSQVEKTTTEWDGLLEDDESTSTEESPVSTNEAEVREEEVVAETPVTEEVAASEETVTEEEIAPTPEAAAEETDTETPEVEVPPVVEETPQDTRTAEEVQTALKEARETAQAQLTEQYRLTDDEVVEFERDPNSVLPKMAAKMYLDMFDSVMQGVQSQVPIMVQNVLQQQEVRQAADKAFYGAWPQLAKAEYRATIDRIAGNYQQTNPTVDAETAIKEIGAQAWVALRLPLDELLKHTGGVPVSETTTPTQTTSVTRIPASAGNAPAPEIKPTLNAFGQLAEDFLQEDVEE